MRRSIDVSFVQRLWNGDGVETGSSPYANLMKECWALDPYDRPLFVDMASWLTGERFAACLTEKAVRYLTAMDPQFAPPRVRWRPGLLERFKLDDDQEESGFTNLTGLASSSDGSLYVITQLYASLK
jgi:hypothetical protein